MSALTLLDGHSEPRFLEMEATTSRLPFILTRSCVNISTILQVLGFLGTGYWSNNLDSHVSIFNPLNAELNPIYLLALLAHHFLHVSRIRVKAFRA